MTVSKCSGEAINKHKSVKNGASLKIMSSTFGGLFEVSVKIGC